jgi:putative membrane protein
MLGWCQSDTGWVGWSSMTVIMLVFWALVILSAVAIWRGTGRAVAWSTTGQDPMQVLDERFARGEIDEREYQERRGLLQSLVQWPPSAGRHGGSD